MKNTALNNLQAFDCIKLYIENKEIVCIENDKFVDISYTENENIYFDSESISVCFDLTVFKIINVRLSDNLSTLNIYLQYNI